MSVANRLRPWLARKASAFRVRLPRPTQAASTSWDHSCFFLPSLNFPMSKLFNGKTASARATTVMACVTAWANDLRSISKAEEVETCALDGEHQQAQKASPGVCALVVSLFRLVLSFIENSIQVRARTVRDGDMEITPSRDNNPCTLRTLARKDLLGKGFLLKSYLDPRHVF